MSIWSKTIPISEKRDSPVAGTHRGLSHQVYDMPVVHKRKQETFPAFFNYFSFKQLSLSIFLAITVKMMRDT